MPAAPAAPEVSLAEKIVGKRLASARAGEEKIGVWAGIPILGLDGLSSAAYGPEAALTLLMPLGAAGLAYVGPITLLIIVVLLLLVYLSYRQTIAAYPNGGGSYTVAKENLGTRAGLLAGGGADDRLHPQRRGRHLGRRRRAGLGGAGAAAAHAAALPGDPRRCITVVNLRGTRESGLRLRACPTYLFVATPRPGADRVGVAKALLHGGHPQPVVAAAAAAGRRRRRSASGCCCARSPAAAPR